MSALAIAAAPFRLTHRLTYLVLRVCGHVLMLPAIFWLVYTVGQSEGMSNPAILMIFLVCGVANRMLNVAAGAIKPTPRLGKTVMRAPKDAPPPASQRVSVVVGRRRTPSDRTIRRMVPAELRGMVR